MKLNIKDDTTLLRLLHDDRAAGFRALFDAYYTPLCLFSVQYTDDFAVSEDIVQTFFVSFWEKQLHTKVAKGLRYYMFSAIRNNTLKTHLRRAMKKLRAQNLCLLLLGMVAGKAEV